MVVIDSRSDRGQMIELLSRLALFADLSAPELEAIAHILEDRRFADGERVLRQGLSGSGFYIILDGEAEIRVAAKGYGILGRGEFFGEVSSLLGVAPIADIVAVRSLRCAVIPGPALETFMVGHPRVLFRMLQAEARKLQQATSWRS